MMALRHKKRVSGSDGGHWICFSDLMSSLVMVFIVVMLCTMYQYYDMLEVKTAELLRQSGLLTTKEDELDKSRSDLEQSQSKLTDAETALAAQQAKLLLQQQALDEAQALLDSQTLQLTDAQNNLASAQQQMSQQTAKIEALVGVRSQIITELATALSNANLQADIDPNTGAITFDSGVFFETGKYALTPAGQAYLNTFIPIYFDVLLGEPNINYVSEVIVEGHTDQAGDYMYNLDLSQKRALAVSNYLLGVNSPLPALQIEVLREIMTANGRSYSNPVLYPDGSVNADASRRVEFKFRLKDSEMIDEMRRLLESIETESGGLITTDDTTAPAA